MSKYIKLESLKWHSPDESIAKPLTEFYITESDIADLPTIDIVHCKDCKHYTPLDESRPFYCSIGIWRVNADDFCSYGERKDNE